MAKLEFEVKKLEKTSVNGGQEYINGDSVGADDINAIVGGVLRNSNIIKDDGDGTKVLNNKGEYVNLQELESIAIVIPDNITDGYVYPNFDDYLTFGTYSVKKHQWSQVIENCPSDFAGTLTVFSASTSVSQDLKKPYRNVIQNYVDVLGDIYIRSEIVGTVDGETGVHTGWQDWKKVLTTDDEIGGSSVTVDTELSDTSTNPVQNKVIKKALDGKVSQTTTSGAIRGYGINTDGEQIVHTICSTDGNSYAEPNLKKGQRIPMYRSANAGSTEVKGYLTTADPKQPYQCANKQFVDENFSLKLYRHKIQISDSNPITFSMDIEVINNSSTPISTLTDLFAETSQSSIFIKYSSTQGVGVICADIFTSTMYAYGCVGNSTNGVSYIEKNIASGDNLIITDTPKEI